MNIIIGKWIFGAYSCSILGFIEHTLRSTRRSLMVAMALDRFLLVFMPFKYPKYHSKVVITLFGITWIATILFRITGLPGILDCYTLATARIFCTFIANCSTACTILGYVDVIILHAASSYVVPTILFSAVYMKTRKMAQLVPLIMKTQRKSSSHFSYFF